MAIFIVALLQITGRHEILKLRHLYTPRHSDPKPFQAAEGCEQPSEDDVVFGKEGGVPENAARVVNVCFRTSYMMIYCPARI